MIELSQLRMEFLFVLPKHYFLRKLKFFFFLNVCDDDVFGISLANFNLFRFFFGS